jgi:hypothetical protein
VRVTGHRFGFPSGVLAGSTLTAVATRTEKESYDKSQHSKNARRQTTNRRLAVRGSYRMPTCRNRRAGVDVRYAGDANSCRCGFFEKTP